MFIGKYQLNILRRTSVLAIGLLLMVCVLQSSFSQVLAADYDVSAKVSAPTSGQPAVITSPRTGAKVSANHATISGTCPVLSPQLFVLIWRNSDFLGSTVCAFDGTFSVDVTLSPGDNPLTPKLMNITNDPGVDGQPVVIIYSPPVSSPPATSSPPERSPSPVETTTATLPLTVASDDEFLVSKPNGEVTLTINVQDGYAPYVMRIDWGDGSSNTYHFSTAGKKKLTHIYGSSKGHSIKVRVTDKTGKTVSLVLGTVVSVVPGLSHAAARLHQNTGPLYYGLVAGGVAAVGGLAWFGLHNAQLARSVKSKPKPKKLIRTKRGKS